MKVVLDTTKVQIFKQITTGVYVTYSKEQLFQIPQRYRFSSKSQRNYIRLSDLSVVLDTTKVQIFKQITTSLNLGQIPFALFQIPQRYRFSSKSQQNAKIGSTLTVVLDTTKVQIFKQITTDCQIIYYYIRCFRYHKGTDFQANHNITNYIYHTSMLFQIPQRYRFSSKSQRIVYYQYLPLRCFRYHKGTDFQANHNLVGARFGRSPVVLDTTKVQIFKQITTIL